MGKLHYNFVLERSVLFVEQKKKIIITQTVGIAAVSLKRMRCEVLCGGFTRMTSLGN